MTKKKQKLSPLVTSAKNDQEQLKLSSLVSLAKKAQKTKVSPLVTLAKNSQGCFFENG